LTIEWAVYFEVKIKKAGDRNSNDGARVRSNARKLCKSESKHILKRTGDQLILEPKYWPRTPTISKLIENNIL